MAKSSGSNVAIVALLGVGGFMAYRMLNQRANAAPDPTAPQTPSTPGTGNGQIAPLPQVTGAGPAPGRSPTDPRGIRNNNPGNIKYNAANNWRGQIGSDGTFAKFDTMENGLRAMVILLRNYCSMYGLCTIAQIASRWAPAPVNNPTSYAASVAATSGIDVNARLNFNDRDTMVRIMKGITGIENGASWVNSISQAVYEAAFNAA